MASSIFAQSKGTNVSVDEMIKLIENGEETKLDFGSSIGLSREDRGRLKDALDKKKASTSTKEADDLKTANERIKNLEKEVTEADQSSKASAAALEEAKAKKTEAETALKEANDKIAKLEETIGELKAKADETAKAPSWGQPIFNMNDGNGDVCFYVDKRQVSPQEREYLLEAFPSVFTEDKFELWKVGGGTRLKKLAL